MTLADGTKITKGRKSLDIPANSSMKAGVLVLKKYLDKYNPENLMVWLELEKDKKTVSENFLTFVRPKHLDLQEPGIKSSVIKSGSKFTINLKARRPA